jgi:hypothetical protein
MNNAAIVPGLMARNPLFLFQNGKPNARLPADGLKRGCQANDPATNDHQIEFRIHSGILPR